MTSETSELVQQALSKLLETDNVQFDAANGYSHTLSWEQRCHFLWQPDAAILLVTLPVGVLQTDASEARALLMLNLNQGPYLTAGGAVGLQPVSNEIYLSRAFVVNPDNVLASLFSLQGLIVASGLVAQYVEALNLVEINPETGEFIFPQLSEEEFTATVTAYTDDDEEPESDADADEQLDQFHDYARDALQALGLQSLQPDAQGVYHFEAGGLPVLQLRFDDLLQEIVLNSPIVQARPAHLLPLAVDLLKDNLFVMKTNHCVLASSAETGIVSLSFAVPQAALMPDPNALANVISHFTETAREYYNRLTNPANTTQLPGNIHVHQFA